jgi:hypothetical protein
MRDQGFNERGEKLITYADPELSAVTGSPSTGGGSKVSDSTLDSVEDEI